ncbi:hypothetical protein Tco_0726601 [Tanacetum coccineum]|uniref:Uncharacterized protein n=1 Tax=Tanacetum coccineum TaxID=301880 RepID=A0ABQ4YIC6_9ASTR
MEAFIGGPPQSIEGNVTASKPQTLEEAINISQRLNTRNTIDNNNYPKYRNNNNHSNNHNNDNYHNKYNNNNRNNDCHQQQNQKQETFRTYTATNGYTGNHPLCESAQKQTTKPQESILRANLAFVHFRISTLETTLEDIQISSESSSI